MFISARSDGAICHATGDRCHTLTVGRLNKWSHQVKPILYAGLLALGLGFGAGGATAAPAAPIAPLGLAATTNDGLLQNVHRRAYRHCHRRGWQRWCHGPRRYYRHWGGPGIYFHFGTGPRWHRHHGWHRRGWRRW